MVAASSKLRLVPVEREQPTHIMAIKALAEPQTLSRITGIFAQFGVIPATLSSQRRQNFLLVDLQFEGDAYRLEPVEQLELDDLGKRNEP